MAAENTGMEEVAQKEEFSTRGFVRNNLPRFLKFLVVGGSSFLFSEFILFMTRNVFYVPNLLLVEIIAMVLSVTLGYFLNEIWTSRGKGWHGKGPAGMLFRLAAYQLIYAAGNVISISIQLYLFYYHGISVLIGNVLGAFVATPVNYVLSMSLVWRIRILRE